MKFVNRLFDVVREYDARIDSFTKAFNYQWRTSDSLKHDPYKKYWKGVRPSSWKELGIETPLDLYLTTDSLYKDIYKHLEKKQLK